MNDNWPEIIEIMGTISDDNRSRTEIKLALESCLRTLGWRTSNGSMKNNYMTQSGNRIDIVLGETGLDERFRCVLPIQIVSNEPENERIDSVSNIMSELHTKIAIVVGTVFDLFYKDENSDKAAHIGQILFDINNEEGIKFATLLSYHDFNVDIFNAYFENLYKANSTTTKIDNLIRSIITDTSKAEEVLRLYLNYEGFEDEIVDETLKNIGIDIYFKNKGSVTQDETQVPTKLQLNKSGHDNTHFSLNGGAFLSKRDFVHRVVSQYIKDNPNVSLEELESRFPSEIASKVRGVVRTWSQVQLWAEQNGPDILTRYLTKDGERLMLSDGTEIVVNSQWGSQNFPKFLALAKKLYDVTSSAPYKGVEHTGKIDYTNNMKENLSHSSDDEPCGKGNGIQISLHSFNSFKTKK